MSDYEGFDIDYNDDRETWIQQRLFEKIKPENCDEAKENEFRIKFAKRKILKYIENRRKRSLTLPVTTEELAKSLKFSFGLINSAVEDSEKGEDSFKLFMARKRSGDYIYTTDGVYQGFLIVDSGNINYTGTFENFMKNNGKKL